jgi:hypothetical protein
VSIFHIVSQGNIGNRMIQHLVAKRIESLVPGCRISNSSLRKWRIDYPEIPDKGRIWDYREEQFVHHKTIKRMLHEGAVDCVRYSGYGQRLENLGDYKACSEFFKSELTGEVGYDDRHLVINIRGGDVLDGRHPGYVLVPIDFYSNLVSQTGLSPVFMGQIEDNPYCQALVKAFPKAAFVPSGGEIHDFEVLRGSVNVIPSVSTFAWLACWLSLRARMIIMPLTGIFNPFMYKEHDFVPESDPRFRFFWFPANFASPVENYELDHAPLAGRYEEIDPGDLVRMRATHHGREKKLDDYVELFDELYYLNRHQDVRAALSPGLPSGLLHYTYAGFGEGRDGFAIDKHWYVRNYPEAARELGIGLYDDPRHHFAAVGVRRGYKPTQSI